MKVLKILATSLVLTSLTTQAQSYWGYGLYGGLAGCGYQVSEAEESSSYKDEIDEVKKQIAEMKKEISVLKRELGKEQADVRRHELALRNNFEPEAYNFIKTHFDEQVRCADYKGQLLNTPGEQKIDPAAVKVDGAVVERKPDSEPPRRMSGLPPRRGSQDNVDEEKTDKDDLTIEPERLAREWADVCDLQKNLKGSLKVSICQKSYILSGVKANREDCQNAIVGYPKAFRKAALLKREIESKQEAIKAAQAQIPELQKSMKEEQAEARRQRQEESREGGLCVECLTGGGGQRQSSQPNWGGVIGNSVMALLSYSSTKNFYNNMASQNANLGFPTQMPMSSPFMSASPYVMGAIGAGLGQGSFGCAGGSGGIGGMGGAMGPYGALGGSGQIGGAFGTPQWALGGQMGGGMYNQGFGSMGMSGPWGLNSMGMGAYPQQMLMGQLGMGVGLGNSMMNPYASLMGGNNFGLSAGLGVSGLMGLGGAGGLMGLGGLTGLNGLGGMTGLSGMTGLNGLSGLGGLNGLSGLNGLGGLTGLDSGMQSQMMQMQLQQQQQLMQSQMQMYENAMQKQKAISGLQSELMGVIQRIQSVQYSSNYLGTSTNYYGLGSSYSTQGGLPTTSTTVPLPLGSR
ncbi:MAG: hypothetical protein JNL11_07995 [Bdellovibrionaceae bacterium]|nr:hypothetical protein [Pseudobdellovibrionaceae bacterium]